MNNWHDEHLVNFFLHFVLIAKGKKEKLGNAKPVCTAHLRESSFWDYVTKVDWSMVRKVLETEIQPHLHLMHQKKEKDLFFKQIQKQWRFNIKRS